MTIFVAFFVGLYFAITNPQPYPVAPETWAQTQECRADEPVGTNGCVVTITAGCVGVDLRDQSNFGDVKKPCI